MCNYYDEYNIIIADVNDDQNLENKYPIIL